MFLFDVNVLIAIADSEHSHHTTIHEWLSRQSGGAWASCPLTENGFVRVVSQPIYRGGARSPCEAIDLLRRMKQAPRWKHYFWADECSLTDPSVFHDTRIAGPRQITDLYITALAHSHQARLVTFDASIPWQAVVGASADTILVLTS
ncbi:MAG: PIN domain-containing protein [Bryobacterales bacterium]|nr:PIN domain-containing protein [Bryobacterales bacterium]